jgi:glycosyltransferase involved in cell wall biosynthesis
MPNERRQGGVVLGAEVGLDLLLEALRLFPGARIELIGERPLAPELTQHPQLSLAGGLEGEELQARLECAAYLVVPAVNGDPLPRELIDGFANGLPVIAPAEGAASELIVPGRNGLLFEPASPRDLARRLAWAEAFPEKMRQMGECARADYLARFIGDWSYQKLYGERRRTARF